MLANPITTTEIQGRIDPVGLTFPRLDQSDELQFLPSQHPRHKLSCHQSLRQCICHQAKMPQREHFQCALPVYSEFLANQQAFLSGILEYQEKVVRSVVQF
jgi:hypothetical protein